MPHTPPRITASRAPPFLALKQGSRIGRFCPCGPKSMFTDKAAQVEDKSDHISLPMASLSSVAKQVYTNDMCSP
jgi:hypothetical protein